MMFDVLKTTWWQVEVSVQKPRGRTSLIFQTNLKWWDMEFCLITWPWGYSMERHCHCQHWSICHESSHLEWFLISCTVLSTTLHTNWIRDKYRLHSAWLVPYRWETKLLWPRCPGPSQHDVKTLRMQMQDSGKHIMSIQGIDVHWRLCKKRLFCYV